MNKGFSIPAQLTGINTKADRSITIRFNSSLEVEDKQLLEILRFRNHEGWLLFKENEVSDAEIPKEDADIERKTPSQRLRAVYYLLWEKEGKKGRFSDYYISKMEYLIDFYKGKLDG